MTIYWPDNLPLGIKYGAETEFGKGNKISTDMDYGNRRRRRRFTKVPAYQTISFKLTDSQLTQFEAFYSGVLLDGVVSFNTNVIVGGEIEQRRCTIDDDSLKVTATDYNYNDVSFVLEIYDAMPYEDGYAYLIGLYGIDFVSYEMCDPLQYIVNVQYPAIMVDY